MFANIFNAYVLVSRPYSLNLQTTLKFEDKKNLTTLIKLFILCVVYDVLIDNVIDLMQVLVNF